MIGLSLVGPQGPFWLYTIHSHGLYIRQGWIVLIVCRSEVITLIFDDRHEEICRRTCVG